MPKNFFCPGVQKFIELCEIPELYEGISNGSVTIDIDPGQGYNNINPGQGYNNINPGQGYNNIITAAITINCSNPDIAIKIHSHRDIFDTVIECVCCEWMEN